jgi:predicted transcriptional regulator of viral defense system
MMTKIEKLLNSSQNVFTTQDLSVIWRVSDKNLLYNNIRYYLRTGKLNRVYKGIYSIRDYSSFEVAQKLTTPSYISFYSALAFHGVIFQLYTSIHSMALNSKKFLLNDKNYVYHKLKAATFFDSLGIDDKGTYYIASPERAVCDSLYLVSDIAFDNLKMIDFEKLKKISKIYDNKRLELEVEKIITTYRK